MIDESAVMQAISDFNFSTPIRIVNCHAEGEVGDVIVSGVVDIPCATLRDQSRYLAPDQRLRNYVLLEPKRSGLPSPARPGSPEPANTVAIQPIPISSVSKSATPGLTSYEMQTASNFNATPN